MPRSAMHNGARAALVLAGFTAVTGQIVLLRELIQLFNGNEISLGILLACWLLWTAAGSALAGVLLVTRPRRAVAVLQVLLAAALPATIWVLRCSRQYLQTVPGEQLGPVPMLADSLVCLSLFCLFSGAVFVAAARLAQAESLQPARTSAASAYLLEAAGSAVGGVLSSLVFLRFLAPFQIVLLVSLANLCLAALLAFRVRGKRALLVTAAAALAAIPLLLALAPRLESASRARLWTGFDLVASRDSVYGNLAVTQTGGIRSLYANGVLLANAPDPSAAEESVDYALLEHPSPGRVLLIGGGANGSLAEALAHPSIAQLDYIELDPALIALARQTLPAPFPPDPRLRIHLADGRRFLASSAERYDAILIDLPDPQTAQLNRYYTAEFFRIVRAHLRTGGLLALELRSSEETLSPGLQEFLRSIRRTLGTVFPRVIAIPGETLHFFASADPAALTEDPAVLLARLHARGLHPQYVNQYILPYRMTADRMEQIHAALLPTAATPVNRDLAPVAYSFSVLLWSAQFGTRSTQWFRAAAHLSFVTVLAVFALILLTAVTAALLLPNRARTAAAGCTAAAGFTLMALQIVLLLGFESVYGYVYHQLAILIGLFMAGLALGGWLGLRRSALLPHKVLPALALTQALLALAVPALVLAVGLLAHLGGSAANWLAAQLAFPVLALLAGALGGYEFPLAAALFVPEGESCTGLGLLYALDLLGGCAGALLLGTWLIPVYGFERTAVLAALLNAAALVPILGIRARR